MLHDTALYKFNIDIDIDMLLHCCFLSDEAFNLLCNALFFLSLGLVFGILLDYLRDPVLYINTF